MSIKSIPITLVIVSFVTYAASRWIYLSDKNNHGSHLKTIGWIKTITILLCVAMIVVCRKTSLFATLGNSYFTLKAIGYMLDSSKNKKYYEKNFFFYLFYLIYFPTILQGPFNRYKEFKKQFEKTIDFDYICWTHGLQRILWGIFKKLVIATRMEQISTWVYGDISGKNGITLILGVISYTLWLYLDFSSYMDMIIGVSKIFGIDLPENFKQPFFSKSVAEFWRRWHITLGEWFKDYVFMPLLTSSIVNKAGKWTKSYVGKKWGGYVISVFPLVFVWLLTGLWHGTGWDYVIWGMYYCVIISISTILAKSYVQWKKKIGVKDNSFLYSLFCYLRTIILVLIANIILEAGNIDRFASIFSTIMGKTFICGECIRLSSIGWKPMDVAVVFIGVLAIAIVAIIKELGKDIFMLVDQCALPIRWGLYYTLIFTVIIFGIYGNGYDTSAFMYSNF